MPNSGTTVPVQSGRKGEPRGAVASEMSAKGLSPAPNNREEQFSRQRSEFISCGVKVPPVESERKAALCLEFYASNSTARSVRLTINATTVNGSLFPPPLSSRGKGKEVFLVAGEEQGRWPPGAAAPQGPWPGCQQERPQSRGTGLGRGNNSREPHLQPDYHVTDLLREPLSGPGRAEPSRRRSG